jgi:ATP-binding cassette subfamily B protein
MADALNFLDPSKTDNHLYPVKAALEFKKYLSLNAISFRYPESETDVLRNLSLLIPKGERIGFIGNTGGGKSTLLDIVMGLLHPTKGVITVDGEVLNLDSMDAWQKKIAHVPQSIFLSDSTVLENIAFGMSTDEIDEDRVRQAAIKAQIHHDIESWPLKYSTIVGERGVRISGGQRQRLGIARALYRNAEILIFDEATSALDNQTEKAVINILRELSNEVTILMIAHRVTTLQGCSRICRLDQGEITQIGTYEEVIGNQR